MLLSDSTCKEMINKCPFSWSFLFCSFIAMDTLSPVNLYFNMSTAVSWKTRMGGYKEGGGRVLPHGISFLTEKYKKQLINSVSYSRNQRI